MFGVKAQQGRACPLLPSQTSGSALQMSAIGGKADMAIAPQNARL
jgi:hypothetical protein